MEFLGEAQLAGGISLRVDKGGSIIFGNIFTCNSYCFFTANKMISFGDNCALGWNVKIRDTDGHTIYSLEDPKKQININREVYIGNHEWIASYVKILKGIELVDDCVVAYRTMLTGQNFKETNCIIGGNLPRGIKENINWRF